LITVHIQGLKYLMVATATPIVFSFIKVENGSSF